VFVYQYPKLTLKNIDTMQLQPMIQTSHQRSNHFTFFRFVKDQTAFCQKDQAQATDSLCLRLFSSVSFGGGRRDRTDDPLLAKQVLSQLSYAPSSHSKGCTPITWWVRLESNQRPPPYQDGALTD
jgi:hypothetical protein